MNLKIAGVLGTEEKYPKQWKGVKNTNEYVLFYGPPNPPEMAAVVSAGERTYAPEPELEPEDIGE